MLNGSVAQSALRQIASEAYCLESFQAVFCAEIGAIVHEKRVRTVLVEAAWAASRTKDTYLGSPFHRLRARRGDKRAAVAVAHSILIVVYYLLAKPEAVFTELGGDYFLKRNPAQEQRRAIRKLEGLGFTVTLTPAGATAATTA